MDFRVLPIPQAQKCAQLELTIPARVSYEDPMFEPAAFALSSACDTLYGLSLAAGEGGVRFLVKPELPEGAYEIRVGDMAKVYASGAQGAQHAAATLAQSIRRGAAGLTLPKGEIADAPQYEWRGVMVDLARRWHPISYLYRYVDLCWFYKLNVLHLHFTDEQSYTLPSRAFPKLCTPLRHYSEAQLRAVADYAASKGVQIVPEIDLPGHCGSFQAAYPEVFGTLGILCAEEKTFDALETLFGELIDLFPESQYIHIGGDEAEIARWDDCPGCVAYREAHGLADIHALYAHYVDRVAKIVLKRGRKPVAWEGFAKAHNDLVTKELIMFAWENYYQSAPELAEAGFTLINASWKPTYVCTPNLMWPRAELLKWNPRVWTHWWEKSKAYNARLTVPDETPVLGGQMCAWGDSLVSYESDEAASSDEFARVRERVGALAERTWGREWDDGKPGDAADALFGALDDKARRLCGR